MSRSISDLRGLLDDSPLDGAVGVRRELGPRVKALAVKGDSVSNLRAAISHCCECWGGASFPLIPGEVSGDFTSVDPLWQGLLARVDPDWIDLRELPKLLLDRRPTAHEATPGVGEPLLAVIASSSSSRNDRVTLGQWEFDEADPWYLGYLCTLGTNSPRPTPTLLREAGLRSDLNFSDLMPVNVSRVEAPGPDDLLERLNSLNPIAPALLTTLLLTCHAAEFVIGPRGETFPPSQFQRAASVGPNIVVVYTPGDVLDGALLWNLRAANGVRAGLPLGVPVSADVPSVIVKWQLHRATTGFFPHDIALVSVSVPQAELQLLAQDARMGTGFVAVLPVELLRPWRRPSRTEQEVAVFTRGAAQLQVQSQSDRARLARDHQPTRGGGLIAHFEVLPQPLPNLPPLHGLGFPFPPAYRHGGFEVEADRYDELAEVRWPRGWHLLEWAARQRGLGVRASTQGRVSTALLTRLGGMDQLRPLLSPDLIELLYGLGRSKAMSWFKEELEKIRREVHVARAETADERAAFEAAIARIGGPPTEDRITLTDSGLQTVLRNSAARKGWLSWAETRGLLIRGVRVHCQECGDRYWRPAGEAFSSPVCRGCGQPIPGSSFGPTVTFEYRASEPLLQVIEHDALPHLLTARWIWDAFDLRSGRESLIYGLYPGADFFDLETRTDYGDADVILLLGDGNLVPIECKLRAAGLNESELEKFDRLNDKLGAPWSLLATLSPASQCGPLWKSAAHDRRRVLTGEHIYDRVVVRALGQDVFVQRDETNDERTARKAAFEGDFPQLTDALSHSFDIEEMWLRDSAPG